ncbi:Bug family tripartite tricarboxylate transporter substrate binding protein [Amorphus sp. MBR-141]
MTHIRIRHLLTSAAVVAGLSTAFAATPTMAEYPEKPVRMVVGFGAGGPTDVPARLLAEKLSEASGQRFLVENKPGASSMLAGGDVYAQPADGYTVHVCSYLDPVNTKLFSSVPFHLDDIGGVTTFSEYSYVVVAANDLPVETMEEFMAYAKEHSGELNYGNLGPASSANFVGLAIQKAGDIEMVGLPFKGAADAIQEVAAGRIQIFFAPPLVAKPQVDSGRVKVLATTGSERNPVFSDVPTLQEAGVDVIAKAWLGICVDSETPTEIVDSLNAMVTEATAARAFVDLIESSGSSVKTQSPAEFDALIEQTATDVVPLIEEYDLGQQ